MRIHELSPNEGSRKNRKRVGRGPGSGHGKTACRGHKGQRSRSGSGARAGFEGGQMPLQRRLPKRGFQNPFRKIYQIVNIGDLDRFEPQTEVDRRLLRETGLIGRKVDGIKLLANGEVTKPLVVKVDKVSLAAKSKIEAAGGRIEAA